MEPQPLLPSKAACAHDGATVLDKKALDNGDEEEEGPEEGVREETFEEALFHVGDPGVEKVEDLAEHEGVEESAHRALVLGRVEVEEFLVAEDHFP